jgi:hypothetical protein
MGFGLSPGVSAGWSSTAPTTGQPERQAAPTPPYRYIPPLEPDPPKKKHRIGKVAVVTIASLWLLSAGLRGVVRSDQTTQRSSTPTPSIVTRPRITAPRGTAAPEAAAAPGSPVAPADDPPVSTVVVPSATRATPVRTGAFTIPQQSERQRLLATNFRLVLVGESPTLKVDAEIRFMVRTVYSFEGNLRIDGEDTHFEIVVIGSDRYVRSSALPELGDRWLVNPTSFGSGLVDLTILDHLGFWDTFSPKFLEAEDLDGTPVDHYSLGTKGNLKAAEVWADGSGIPLKISEEIGGEDAETDTYRVFYNEPVQIVAPTNVITEADYLAGR